MCTVIFVSNAITKFATVKAMWLTTAAQGQTLNGCRFNCPGGTSCRLRGSDALPVELLDFAIGDPIDPHTEDRPETDDGAPEDDTDSKR